LETLGPLLTTVLGALIAYVTTLGSARRQHAQAVDLRKLELQAETDARTAEEEVARARRKEDRELADAAASAERDTAAAARKRQAVEEMLDANVRVERVATERWVSDIMEGPPASALHDAVEDWERFRARALLAGVEDDHLTQLVSLTDDQVSRGFHQPGAGPATHDTAAQFRQARWFVMLLTLR